MPLSESRELADRPETEETEEAVETERSSCGTALRASEGETHGSGERQRSGGGEGVDSMARCGRCVAVVQGAGSRCCAAVEWVLVQCWCREVSYRSCPKSMGERAGGGCAPVVARRRQWRLVSTIVSVNRFRRHARSNTQRAGKAVACPDVG